MIERSECGCVTNVLVSATVYECVKVECLHDCVRECVYECTSWSYVWEDVRVCGSVGTCVWVSEYK